MGYLLVKLFNTLNGKVNIALINENTPSTAIPNSRNGNNRSQITGYSKRANRAIGQHSINRIHQMKNANIII